MPRSVRRSASRRSWVDFPVPSPPSKTMSRPPFATASAERDDRARRALLDPVHDPIVHARHQLVEILLRRHEPLIRRLALHLAEQCVEIFLHLVGGTLAALDHLLRVHAKLLHLLEQRDRCVILAERIVRALHGLILGALPDHPPELLGLVLDHSNALRRLATTNRSRPVRSSCTRTSSYAPAVATSSATSDARRMSTSIATSPGAPSARAASRTSRAVAPIPSEPLNSATVGSQSRTLVGSASRSSHAMYGGLETTARNGRSRTGPSSE